MAGLLWGTAIMQTLLGVLLYQSPVAMTTDNFYWDACLLLFLAIVVSRMI
jgi:hypothetical protein